MGHADDGRKDKNIAMIKSGILPISIVAIFYLFLGMMGITCPIKYVTGISCAGCGMSRAMLSLLRLDVNAAFHYHPLFALPFVAAILFFLRDRIPRKVLRAIFIVMVAVFIAVWLIRMFDPADDIVVFRPTDSLFFRMIRAFAKI